MTLRAWLDYNARTRTPDPTDTIELPEVMVTETDLTDEEWLRFTVLLNRFAYDDYVVVEHAP